ncbi:MAG: CPBP family intramembrane metalloprotease [Planctomycetales bacterium]|nr:CPBP family intramembrane metalloprotease [Planctomycetales bacterium]
MKAVRVMVLFAAAGFFVLFSPWTKNAVPFFPMMTITAAFLAAASLIPERNPDIYAFKFKFVPLGLLAAACLYLLFWIGHFVSIRILPFAASQVESIYTIRAGQNPWLIAPLLFFVIGPAEEIFWRGFVQRRLSKRYGVFIGFVAAAAIYALVHVWSFNLMLIAAAALCGVFWGVLFVLTNNLWPCMICHAVWDVVILILIPVK